MFYSEAADAASSFNSIRAALNEMQEGHARHKETSGVSIAAAAGLPIWTMYKVLC